MNGEIRIPASGELGSDITLVTWRKSVGDAVERGEIVAEIEADKGLLEIEAVESGTLGEILKEEGDFCEPGDVIGKLGEHGFAEKKQPAKNSVQPAEAEAVPAVRKGEASPGSVRAVPAARKQAAELGLHLEDIEGTGPGGVITARDVDLAAGQSTGPKQGTAAGQSEATNRGAAAKGQEPEGDSAAEKDDIPVELTFNQRLVLSAVERSNREIPTVRFSTEINMARTVKERESLGVRYDAFYLHALGRVLLRHKAFLRYCLREGGKSISVYQRKRCNVALAVAQKDRLYTPVIKDIDLKTPQEIDKEIEDTVWDIVDGTWKNEREPGGEGCMLLSNLGMYPVSNFDALVYPGQSSAVAVGQIVEKTAVSQGGIHILPLCTATIAIDHRIVNGKDAAEFLQDLKRILETGSIKPAGKGAAS